MIDAADDMEFQNAIDRIRSAQNIVVFTGAGISSASGIATFRDDGGFWKRFPPEQFANWKGLLETALLQPSLLAEFLITVLEPIAAATPNEAHLAIAKLQRFRSTKIVTQNIDRLHQESGSESVYEIHGSLFDIINMNNGTITNRLTREDLKNIVEKLHTSQNALWSGPGLLKAIQPLLGINPKGMHRPNLVLFGDQLAEPDWSDAMEATEACDLFLSVGTSQAVYPAASLPQIAQEQGAVVITVDPLVSGGDIWLQGKSETELPKLVQAAFADEKGNDA